MIKLIENSLAMAGQMMLEFAQTYYIEPRLMRIQGSGGAIQVKRFTQADIAGGISIKARTGSGLPRTRAGKQAMILNLVTAGIMQPDEAYKHLDLGDMTGVAKMMRADEDQAFREHDKIIQGQPTNVVSYKQALEQLEAGQLADPNTGQPISDPNQAQQALMNAGLQPHPFENFTQHMEAHALFMKSPDFEALPIQVQEAFQTHYMQTLQYYLQLPKPVQYEAVRPTLQIKSTIGPTGAADILNRAGVYQITPQVMAEPPLDTWVTDDLTKPEAQTSGNSGNQPQQEMQAAQVANTIEQDKEAHAQKLNVQAQEHAMNVVHSASQETLANQLQSHKIREQAAKADLAERTAKEKQINPPKQPKKKPNGK